ncbi:MAG TPA: sigma-70 family RNA polymerase sigma factor [Bacteroidales bacterium]|nr:sigma-70 family RNA polymerase sigma factor [Bacteroidales bacterium]
MDYKGDIYYIEQVLGGKVNAFTHLVDRHKDNVFNLALRISGNREDAEEIAQDSFLKAYRSLEGFKMNSTFSTWLYRIVYNSSISLIRKRREKILSIQEFPADAADFLSVIHDEDAAIEEYKRSLVAFALQNLNEEDRAIITLFYYEEMDTEKISQVTGLSRQNVKVRLFRARQKMSEIIVNAEKKNTVCHEDK